MTSRFGSGGPYEEQFGYSRVVVSKGRRKKARRMVAKVAARGNNDPVATILKVKGWANEVGGLRRLKALVDALSE